MSGWRLSGIVGVIGGVALALSIVIVWGHPGGAALRHGTYNRFFADEAGYTATITEYLAPDLVPLDTYATESIWHMTAQRDSRPVCRVLVGFGVAPCESADRPHMGDRTWLSPFTGRAKSERCAAAGPGTQQRSFHWLAPFSIHSSSFSM